MEKKKRKKEDNVKASEREFLREKGEPKKRRGGANKKRWEKRKEKREGRREGRRRGDLRNLMSIGPSNRGRSISNFDITFYSTPETAG